MSTEPKQCACGDPIGTEHDGLCDLVPDEEFRALLDAEKARLRAEFPPVVSRDPRVDPIPGDWVTNGRADVRVDMVKGGEVFAVRWLREHDDEGRAFRVSLNFYRSAMARSDGGVLAMGIPGRGSVWGDDASEVRA